MSQLDALLGLDRFDGQLAGLEREPLRGVWDNRARRRYGLLDSPDDPNEIDDALLERIRSAPAASAEEQTGGPLQHALDILDLPRNAIANLLNLFVGAEPLSKRQGLLGLPQVSAGDILNKLGLSGGESTGGKVVDFLADFLGNVALDPLTYAMGGGKLLASGAEAFGGQAFKRGAAGAAKERYGQLLEKIGRRAGARTPEEAQAAQRAFLERLGQRPVRQTQRGLGIDALRSGAQPQAAGQLASDYFHEQGGQALQRIAARQVARESPELLAPALGVGTSGLKEFHPLDLPAVLGLGVSNVVAPELSGKVLNPAWRSFRQVTKPLLNPLSVVLPEASATLLSQEAARALGAQLGLGKLGQRIAGLPGVGPLLEGARQAGRELRGKFSTQPLPPKPGDLRDLARFQTESFEKFVNRRTAQAQRAIAWDEPRKLRPLIQEAASAADVPFDAAASVIFDLGERLRSVDEGTEAAANVAVSARRILQRFGEDPDKAEKLVSFVRAAPRAARPAQVARAAADEGKNAVPDLAPERPAHDLDLFGRPIIKPLAGGQGVLFEPQQPSLKTPAQQPEVSDGLRAMTAKALLDIPGAKAPDAQALRAALVNRYGAAAVEAALKDAQLRTPAGLAQIQAAADQANKGGFLFARPDAPDLAPAAASEGGGEIVYHGTRADFKEFGPQPSNIFADDRGRYFFSSDPKEAKQYAEHPLSERMTGKKPQGTARVIAARLDLKKPFIEELSGRADPTAYYDEQSWWMPKPGDGSGYDGIIVRNADTGEALHVAFDPKQINIVGNDIFPDLAPAQRKIGDAFTMVDRDLNEYDGRLEVVAAESLSASHQPKLENGRVTALKANSAYPAGFQARERGAEASVKQVAAIARSPKFDLLTDFGPGVTDGPPVVFNLAGQPTVIQGNGRVAGMLAWSKQQWAEYRQALAARGIDLPPEMEKPILVRTLIGDEAQARRLAALGQESAALRQTSIEKARAELNALGVKNVDDAPPVKIDGPITRDNVLAFIESPANRTFKNWLLGGLTPQRREQLLSGPDELAEKVSAVFLGTLPPAVQKLAASAPKAIEDMFTQAAPVAAYLRSLRRQGLIRPEYDLYDALEQGAHFFNQLRSRRGSYSKIMRDLDEIAQTPTLAGLRDELADATQRGLSVAVGFVKASRSANPGQTLLEGLGKIVAAARADDPNQFSMLSVDSAESAARAYAGAFLPPAQAEKLLRSMSAVRAAETARLKGVPGEQGVGVTASGAAALPDSAGPGPGGPAAAPPSAGIQPAADAAAPAAPAAAAADVAAPSAAHAELFGDVDAYARTKAIAPQKVAAWKTVIARFSPEALRGLRLSAGTADEAAEIAAARPDKLTPAASFHFADTLTGTERARLAADGLIKLFNSADRYDDAGLFLEEAWHHLFRNVLSDPERAAVNALHASKTPGEWSALLKQRPRGEFAAHYAASPNELGSRLFADWAMGRELAGNPEMRSIFQRAWDALRGMWNDLLGRGSVDEKIRPIFERYFAAAPPSWSPGMDRPSAGPPVGPLGPGLTPPLRYPAEFELPVRGGPVGPPLRGAQEQLPLPRTQLGPPGRLTLSDPVRDVANYLQSRATLRIAAERAADVPARELTTQRQMGYLTRFLVDGPDTRIGTLLRKGGMSIRSFAQKMRSPAWREKFASEINSLVEGVNEVLAGKAPRTGHFDKLISQMGLKQGQALPLVSMDPVLAHVARELESVRLIGSAEYLKESARRFGLRIGQGQAVPAGYTWVKTPAGGANLGDLTREFAFPQEVAGLLERHVAALGEPSRILKGYRQLLNAWKGLALLAPAYHLRNLLGNVWNLNLLDAWRPEAMLEARRVQKAVASGQGLDVLVTGTGLTRQALYRQALVDEALVGGLGFYGQEFRVSFDRTQELLGQIDNPAGFAKIAREMQGRHPLRANQALGQIGEEAGRLSGLIARLQQGDDFGTAAGVVRKALFDYGDLTDLERGTPTRPGLRDAIPFYTFSRKNAELLWQMAFTQPGKLAMIPKIQLSGGNALAGDEQLSPALTPAHVLSEGGMQISGGAQPRFLNLGYMLPIGEARFNPLAPAQALRAAAQEIGGPARTAVELLANRDLFFDRPIREYPEQQKEFLGMAVPPGLKHALRSVRPLNALEQMRQMGRSAQDAGGALAGVAAQVSGVRAVPVDARRQVFEAARRIDDQSSAVRRDLRRRLAELQRAGRDPVGDAEMTRLVAQHEALRQQRAALPVKEAQALPEQAKQLSKRRQELLQALLEQAAAG